MDVIWQVARAVIMMGALVLIVMLMAALFMIFFNIATGIDEQIQE